MVYVSSLLSELSFNILITFLSVAVFVCMYVHPTLIRTVFANYTFKSCQQEAVGMAVE